MCCIVWCPIYSVDRFAELTFFYLLEIKIAAILSFACLAEIAATNGRRTFVKFSTLDFKINDGV